MSRQNNFDFFFVMLQTFDNTSSNTPQSPSPFLRRTLREYWLHFCIIIIFFLSRFSSPSRKTIELYYHTENAKWHFKKASNWSASSLRAVLSRDVATPPNVTFSGPAWMHLVATTPIFDFAHSEKCAGRHNALSPWVGHENALLPSRSLSRTLIW